MDGEIENWLRRSRLSRGLTQEGLADATGVSVRTIRNLERGVLRAPRRSTVEMLARVLESTPPAATAPAPGPRAGELHRAAELVLDARVLLVCGPSGVGKTSLALALGGGPGGRFPHPVAVELGRLPAERRGTVEEALARSRDAVARAASGDRDDASALGLRGLVVLDNAEHRPVSTALLVRRLLQEHPGLHVVVTSRRPLSVPDARILELAPLGAGDGADLLLERAALHCPGLDLTGESPRLRALSRQLDGLPRYLEFAAHRLRTMPLAALGDDGAAARRLGVHDATMMTHQFSPRSDIDWSLGLLDDRHRWVLTRLAGPRTPAAFCAATLPAAGRFEMTEPELSEILADLADASLLQVIRRPKNYFYRMYRHVDACLREDPRALQGACQVDATRR